MVAVPDVRLLAAIAAGGVLGAISRAGVAGLLQSMADAGVWSTAIVNVLGAFVIGVLAVRLPTTGDAWWHRPFWITGVLGGFTTFSAYALETVGLLDRGLVWAALAYLVGTVVFGLLAVTAGIRVAGGGR